MSTPDQPPTPPLTRRQMREIRHTGATPVLTPEHIAQSAAAAHPPEAPAEAEPAESVPANTVDVDDSPGPQQLDKGARVEPEVEVEVDVEPEAEQAPPSTAPAGPAEEDADSKPSIDLGVAPLTRRQAREHERIRTASVPIITLDADHPLARDDRDAVPVEQPLRDIAPAEGRPPAASAEVPGLTRPPFVDDGAPTAIVNPHFGSGLLAGESPVVELPPSFDQLISRTGSVGVSSSTPSALILSQAPAVAPLVAPVTATGEVLITGTFDLPEGLGSVGHAPGLHDGKDADAVLIDGELPAASSPTPIAASAAISQIRNNDEIIRPPAPDRGSRLVLLLGITAGVLGLVLITALAALVINSGVL